MHVCKIGKQIIPERKTTSIFEKYIWKLCLIHGNLVPRSRISSLYGLSMTYSFYIYIYYLHLCIITIKINKSLLSMLSKKNYIIRMEIRTEHNSFVLFLHDVFHTFEHTGTDAVFVAKIFELFVFFLNMCMGHIHRAMSLIIAKVEGTK